MKFFNFDFTVARDTGFQDPATPLMEGIIDLHHHILFFIIVIIILVLWLLFIIVFKFTTGVGLNDSFFLDTRIGLYIGKLLLLRQKPFVHNYVIEIVWTIVPSIILVFIAVPSFTLLYSIDEIVNPDLTFKVIGHQWYWSYEFDDFLNRSHYFDVAFDSYMVPTDDLKEESYLHLRLLEVDAPVYLPIRTHIRVIITASDVLHSWAIPSLGVKCDAVPGRLNQLSLFIKRAGTYYGQCSEICGINHGFMPIVIHAVPQVVFKKISLYS